MTRSAPRTVALEHPADRAPGHSVERLDSSSRGLADFACRFRRVCDANIIEPTSAEIAPTNRKASAVQFRSRLALVTPTSPITSGKKTNGVSNIVRQPPTATTPGRRRTKERTLCNLGFNPVIDSLFFAISTTEASD